MEWADRLGDQLPSQRLELHFSENRDGFSAAVAADTEEDEEDEVEAAPREVCLRAYGQRWADVGKAVSSFIARPPAGSPPLGGLFLLEDDSDEMTRAKREPM